MKTVGGTLRERILLRLADAGHDLGQRMWRDSAPEGATFPYLTFIDPISDVPSLVGNQRVLARTRQIQVDLWQRYKEESDELLVALQRACDAERLAPEDPEGPVAAFTTRLRSTSRVPDPDRSVVHHALTVAVAHRSST